MKDGKLEAQMKTNKQHKQMENIRNQSEMKQNKTGRWKMETQMKTNKTK